MKCSAALIALVQTGSYSAASSNPTTAALTPASAAWLRRLPRSRSQNGNAPNTSRKEGANTASRQMVAPSQPLGPLFIEAPRKAAKVNSGPGTAWAAP